MSKHISGKLVIGFTLGIPLASMSIGGHASYAIQEDSMEETQNLILRFEKISFIEEMPHQFYLSKQFELKFLNSLEI